MQVILNLFKREKREIPEFLHGENQDQELWVKLLKKENRTK